MIIGILSIFIGIQGGLVFSNFFLLVTSKLTNSKGLYLYWPTEAIIVTTVTFIILFLIVSTFTPMFIRTRKTTQLIKELTKRRVKKPSILISLFAVICLGLCYYIAGYPRGYVTEKMCKMDLSFYYVIYFTTRNSRDIFILFTNISSFYLYFKEA